MLLGRIVAEAGCNCYDLDINIYSLSKKYFLNKIKYLPFSSIMKVLEQMPRINKSVDKQWSRPVGCD
jgi:hypothetical protein